MPLVTFLVTFNVNKRTSYTFHQYMQAVTVVYVSATHVSSVIVL